MLSIGVPHGTNQIRTINHGRESFDPSAQLPKVFLELFLLRVSHICLPQLLYYMRDVRLTSRDENSIHETRLLDSLHGAVRIF